MEKPSTKKPMNILKTMVFLKNFMKIELDIPSPLILYLMNHKGLYKSETLSELITAIIDDHLLEYQNDYTIEIHNMVNCKKQ